MLLLPLAPDEAEPPRLPDSAERAAARELADEVAATISATGRPKRALI